MYEKGLGQRIQLSNIQETYMSYMSHHKRAYNIYVYHICALLSTMNEKS